jgi:hypothetical protein
MPHPKSRKIYSYSLAALVESQIPAPIREAMNKLGWNAFGIYELVRDEIRIEKRRLKEVGNAG